MPGEIRNLIYYYALVVPSVYVDFPSKPDRSHVYEHGMNEAWTPKPPQILIPWSQLDLRTTREFCHKARILKLPERVPNTALLALNKQTRWEARPIFFENNIFDFLTPELMVRFLAYWQASNGSNLKIEIIRVHLHGEESFEDSMEDWMGPLSFMRSLQFVDIRSLYIYVHTCCIEDTNIYHVFVHELNFSPTVVNLNYIIYTLRNPEEPVTLLSARITLNPGAPIVESGSAVPSKIKYLELAKLLSPSYFEYPDPIGHHGVEVFFMEYPQDWWEWLRRGCAKMPTDCILAQIRSPVAFVGCD